MRAIVLDEVSRADLDKLAEHLRAVAEPSSLPDVFWLNLPADLLSPEQMDHASCGPHRVACVLEEESFRLELLVRSEQTMRCSCVGYATRQQRDFLFAFVDRLIEELDLKT